MIERVAYISMHTSPLLRPGDGAAGGMNVYINELARTMARRDIDVTVFTRCASPTTEEVIAVGPGYRVVNVPAGPSAPMAIADMPPHVAEFTDGVLKWLDSGDALPDVIHSHYWLSGWSGVILKEALGIPLANSFHTLGRVKDINRRPGQPASSPMRTLTEEEVIARSDCVIASTPYEFDDLLEHYGAAPERLCTSPPGIDHDLFTPGDGRAARAWLGISTEAPLVLFVGRIQPLKAADVAVDAFAGLTEGCGRSADAHFIIVGGPSGPDGEGELARLRSRIVELGLSDRVHLLPAQPHASLPMFYRASDVLILPSRSETFGLVATEAQACGLPVVAAAVGGLPFAVEDGGSGLLVDGHDAAAYTQAMRTVLDDTDRGRAMSARAVEFAERFSWDATADRLLELYDGITHQ